MQPDRYGRIIRYVNNTPWALRPETLDMITSLLALRAGGEHLSREEIDERIQSASYAAQNGFGTARTRSGGIAVIPVHGVITHRADMFTDISGGTSVERFRQRFREALADDTIGSILMHHDSPGGSVDLVPEMAAEIRDARDNSGKRIAAIVNTQSASAAYWWASQADEIAVTPSGEVGSIGVYAAHVDRSGFDEQMGIKRSFVKAGKFKTEGNPFEPLGEEARAAIQLRVDDYYRMFVDDVAKGRGVSSSAVRSGFGEGRMVGAKEAVSLGMADLVATRDEMIDRLKSGKKPKRATPARRQSASASYRFSFI